MNKARNLSRRITFGIIQFSVFCFPCDLWTRGILKYTDRSVIYSAQAGCNPRKNRNISCLGDEYAERLLFVPIFYAPFVFARCRSLPPPFKHLSAWNKENRCTGLVWKNVTRDVPFFFQKKVSKLAIPNKSSIFYIERI